MYCKGNTRTLVLDVALVAHDSWDSFFGRLVVLLSLSLMGLTQAKADVQFELHVREVSLS